MGGIYRFWAETFIDFQFQVIFLESFLTFLCPRVPQFLVVWIPPLPKARSGQSRAPRASGIQCLGCLQIRGLRVADPHLIGFRRFPLVISSIGVQQEQRQASGRPDEKWGIFGVGKWLINDEFLRPCPVQSLSKVDPVRPTSAIIPTAVTLTMSGREISHTIPLWNKP